MSRIIREGEGKFVYSTNLIDEETGEVISSRRKYVWSGWKGERYKYRYNAPYVRIFFDAGFEFKKQDLALFWELCDMMNRDNLIVQKIKERNQYETELDWRPLSRQDIFDRLHSRSKSTFDRAWKTLVKGEYIKKINVYGTKVWAVNPIYAMKSQYLNLFLYAGFQDDVDRFLSEATKKKFHNLLLSKIIKGEKIL